MSVIKNNLVKMVEVVANKEDLKAIEVFSAEDVVVYDVDGSVTTRKEAF
jgi:hypothetical protein